MHLRIPFAIIPLFLLIVGHHAKLSGQGKSNNIITRSLSYSEWMDEMASSSDSIYFLSNARIYFDQDKDLEFLIPDTSVRSDTFTRIIDPSVFIVDVIFENLPGPELFFSNIHFTSHFIFSQCTFEEDFNWISCRFDGTKALQRCISNADYVFLNCNLSNFSMYDTEINGRFHIKKTIFQMNGPVDRVLHQTINPAPIAILDCPSGSLMSIILDSVRVVSHSDDQLVIITESNIDALRIYNSIFDTPLILSSLESNEVIGINNEFFSTIDLNNVSFGNFFMGWEQLSGKIVVTKESRKDLRSDVYESFHPTTLEDFGSDGQYKRLIREYNQIYLAYVNNKDTESANACYVEMKDLETQRKEYLYSKEKNLYNWFNWKMNIFLNRFSDYGTNPVKSIIYALRIILIFSIFYFFFHNDWDFLTRDKLRKRMLLLNDYFKTEKGLSSLYEDQERDRYATWREFLSSIEDSKTRIPQYFLKLAKPLYLFSTYSYRNSSKFLKRMDILKGRWSDLEPTMRKRSSFIVGVWIFLYLLFAIFIRTLNALTLSINSFTTLGFGDIPTRGIPRYAAIVQGFIGWFLLTIFSVSLISQLLQ